ncbi:uncharacterized protein EV420DRAFT_1484952 [Desarmillaria tabescens]|uniref:Uncharacterized protein n=1 Tax=Armillaria tabescens TaxID=1929756 RepID=A0AA39JKH2_ARMTA|nr:uncharacterized protein EV420DRAFT_1484952 [Desarmillaria tabescens]KAK0443426.1 hypothetical protein EV420DRAFT_1484952 [Desarmillaria tabescens]
MARRLASDAIERDECHWLAYIRNQIHTGMTTPVAANRIERNLVLRVVTKRCAVHWGKAEHRYRVRGEYGCGIGWITEDRAPIFENILRNTSGYSLFYFVTATSGGSNIYGIPWTGPPSTLFSSDNQTVAISLLLSAIQLADDQASSISSDVPTSSATPSPSTSTSSLLPTRKSLAGAIAGGIVGGLAVLAAVTCHRSNNKNHSVVDNFSPQMLTLFMATSIPVSSEISRESRMNQKKHARHTRRMDVRIESTTPPHPPNPLHTESRENMPTEELVRLLNERLQPGRWNVSEDELPPEYHEGWTT